MINQKAIKIDKETVNDDTLELKLDKKGIILQKGKRGFVRVIGR